jgi:hypothetical protein
MKKIYQVTYKTYKVVEIDDEDLRNAGYEGTITDEERKEFLENLIDEIDILCDDMEIDEITD